MRLSVALAIVPLTFAAGAGSLIAFAESAKGAGRPICAEYTPGRVLAGEMQTLRCDVVNGQALDLVMFPRKLAGITPVERCDHVGGHFQARRMRCVGVDF